MADGTPMYWTPMHWGTLKMHLACILVLLRFPSLLFLAAAVCFADQWSVHTTINQRLVKVLAVSLAPKSPEILIFVCLQKDANQCSWIPWNLSFRYILFHEKNNSKLYAVTSQHQSQFTLKMKANAVPRLLSSLVWIDQYNECNGMTSFMEFMTLSKTW